jgi:ABC-type multidrug transport system fused ATPase/permease subunit
MPGIKLIGNITIGVVLLYGAYLAFEGDVTVGVLAAFLLYLRQFFERCRKSASSPHLQSPRPRSLSGVLGKSPASQAGGKFRWRTSRRVR